MSKVIAILNNKALSEVSLTTPKTYIITARNATLSTVRIAYSSSFKAK